MSPVNDQFVPVPTTQPIAPVSTTQPIVQPMSPVNDQFAPVSPAQPIVQPMSPAQVPTLVNPVEEKEGASTVSSNVGDFDNFFENF